MSPRFRRRYGRHGQGPCPQRIEGFVEPALLLLLHMDTTHGYSLIEALESVGFRDYPVDSSAVYRRLRQLEEAGMVTSEWDTQITSGPPRRLYRLTEAGHQYLKDWVADLRATDRLLHKFLEIYDRHMKEGEGEHHEEKS